MTLVLALATNLTYFIISSKLVSRKTMELALSYSLKAVAT